jgi:hypothetical protein
MGPLQLNDEDWVVLRRTSSAKLVIIGLISDKSDSEYGQALQKGARQILFEREPRKMPQDQGNGTK